MKKLNFYLIIILTFLVLLSCNKVTKKDLSIKPNKNNYILDTDCKAFFESMDFSSFCFSNNKTPKFEVGQNYGMTSRCQYRIYSDKGNFDFLLLISTAPDKFKNIITKLDLNLKVLKSTGYNKIEEFNDLGNRAYIAYNEESQTKELHLVSNNLTIKLELSKINKHESCLYKDIELKKLAKFILKSIKTKS
jgi:hypothetical protein